MTEKPILCDRCKKELNWEQREILKNLPRENLVEIIFNLQAQLNKQGGNTKNGNN